MNNSIVISDSGPLIAFARTEKINLLAKIFAEVIIPEPVLQECIGNSNLPGAIEIIKAIDHKILTIKPFSQFSEYKDLSQLLGPGETSAIILAKQLNTTILIDEKMGRKTAERFNLTVIGSAGILLIAKQKKLIKQIKPILDEFKQIGYFFSNDLYRVVLTAAKET